MRRIAPLLVVLTATAFVGATDPQDKEKALPIQKVQPPIKARPVPAPLPVQVAPPIQVEIQPVQPGQPVPPQPKDKDKKPIEVKAGESFDERTLREDNQATNTPALLEFFKQRTYPDPDPKRLEQLIKQLGDQQFREREKAYGELLKFGASAMIYLKAAERHEDSEIAARSQSLRKRVEEKTNPAVQSAAARLLAERKPAGSVEVLLAFLPYAADEGVVDEVCRTLTAMAVRDGKADAALVAALQEKTAVRRGAAGAALAAGGAKVELPEVRKLMKDADATVRLRVGVALVRQKEQDAIEPLISLLGQLTPEQLWPAEDILLRLAGDKAPMASLGSDQTGRQKCQQAWTDWYAANGKGLDLAKIDLSQSMLGFTLIAQQATVRMQNGNVVNVRTNWQIIELDAARNKRWSFDLPSYAVDAQVIKEDRVLVTEYGQAKVSIRNFKGEVQGFDKRVNGNPLSAHMLPNGSIFVVTQQRLSEYDSTGKEVWGFARPNGDIFRGKKLRNGDVVYITNQGILTRIDSGTQKEIHSFNVGGQMGNLFGTIDVLPNGNYLVPLYQNQRVVELDQQGNVKWQAQVQFPNSAQRLPNGNTLVATQNGGRIIELDRAGREVPSGSFRPDNQGIPFSARRR